MFSTWQKEKAVTALVDEAQALADKLSATKPHFLDSHAAAAQVWVAQYRSTGVNLVEIFQWQPAVVARFVTGAQARIATLRKQRAYDSSDGLAIWLHTARAVSEPRVLPAVREIWRQLAGAGPNADTMTADLLQEAGLPADPSRHVPQGLSLED